MLSSGWEVAMHLFRRSVHAPRRSRRSPACADSADALSCLERTVRAVCRQGARTDTSEHIECAGMAICRNVLAMEDDDLRCIGRHACKRQALE